MIVYRSEVGAASPEQISGFFVGWPSPPTAEKLVDVMDSSFRRVWAFDGERVVGYVNAISDGVLAAFIPWLEVHPDYRGQGIGTELMKHIVAQLGGVYSIDLVCDGELTKYYERLGFMPLAGMGMRNPGALRR
ncbi:GNAT family N-acetyltransferase [Trueperella pyogenes]|uniref:GNAT family N-acetyltransferase n=1 Tax=Trueperella pyogenes TaxID=1661 RepID=UPI003DA9066A